MKKPNLSETQAKAAEMMATTVATLTREAIRPELEPFRKELKQLNGDLAETISESKKSYEIAIKRLTQEIGDITESTDDVRQVCEATTVALNALGTAEREIGVQLSAKLDEAQNEWRETLAILRLEDEREQFQLRFEKFLKDLADWNSKGQNDYREELVKLGKTLSNSITADSHRIRELLQQSHLVQEEMQSEFLSSIKEIGKEKLRSLEELDAKSREFLNEMVSTTRVELTSIASLRDEIISTKAEISILLATVKEMLDELALSNALFRDTTSEQMAGLNALKIELEESRKAMSELSALVGKQSEAQAATVRFLESDQSRIEKVEVATDLVRTTQTNVTGLEARIAAQQRVMKGLGLLSIVILILQVVSLAI